MVIDVLQVVKGAHTEIFKRFTDARDKGLPLTLVTLLKLAQDLKIQLQTEDDYIYSEVEDFFISIRSFSSIRATNAQLRAELDVFISNIKKSKKKSPVVEDKIAKFCDALELHFSQYDDVILPKVRSVLQTEEREDLAIVFNDALEENKRMLKK